MEKNNKKIMVLGMGNDILSDDAVGPKLVWELEKQWAQGVKTETAALGGMEIMEMIQGYDEVIIIDAIMTEGGVPGAVYELEPENFKWALHIDNMHDMSFLQAMEMGKKLKLELPQKIKIIAIEIVEDLEFSNDFSPQIQAKWPEIKERVFELVEKYLSE